ncbi:RIKEN cDNA D930048N14, partial [Mus musculus]
SARRTACCSSFSSSSNSGPRPPHPVSFQNQLPNWLAGMGWSGLCRLFLRWRTVDGLWSLFLSLYLYMASEDQAQVLGLVQQRLRPANHFSCPISNVLSLYQAIRREGWWLYPGHPSRKDWVRGSWLNRTLRTGISGSPHNMNETRFVQAAGLKEGVYPLNCLPLEFIMQTRIREYLVPTFDRTMDLTCKPCGSNAKE